MKQFLAISCLFLCTLLSACNTGWDLDELKSVQPCGAHFNTALAREYQDFSESEADEYDWSSSSYFARKGLAAAYGEFKVVPEYPEKWDIAADKLPELQSARKKLMNLLSEKNQKKYPESLAHAQMLYDCWVEEQEEAWQTDHIASCRAEFFATIANLKDWKRPEKYKATMVFFDFDKYDLNFKAIKTIRDFAQKFGKASKIQIISAGHTDKAGSTGYNLVLSRKRALAVKRALMNEGIAGKNIVIRAYGKSAPLVQTPDGVREPMNRRAEILLKE